MTCYNKQSYLGMISGQSMFLGQPGEPIRAIMINSDNKEARRVWDLLSPLHSLAKSLTRYEDMDIKMGPIE